MFPSTTCPPEEMTCDLGTCPVPPDIDEVGYRMVCPTYPIEDTRGKRLLEDRRRETFLPDRWPPPPEIDDASTCVPSDRIKPPASTAHICESKVCGLGGSPPPGSAGGRRVKFRRGSLPAQPPCARKMTCDDICTKSPPCVAAEEIDRLVGPASRNKVEIRPRGQPNLIDSSAQHPDLRDPPPDVYMETGLVCCPPDLEIEEEEDEDGDQEVETQGKKVRICTCGIGSGKPCPTCDADSEKPEILPANIADQPVCVDQKKDHSVLNMTQFPPWAVDSHECTKHRDRARDHAHGDPESDFAKQMCGCPCCLAFRPHPPATVATTDLYRTCNLPKKYRFPAWFQGYNGVKQHPLYRTSSSEVGRYPPNVHTVPTFYFPIDRTWSKTYVFAGPWRDRGLRNTGSMWDAYTYYDFS